MNVAPRAAVIIGASSGVGRALATALAQQGRALVIAARDGRDLDAVACDLRARYGVPVVPLPLDLMATDADLEAWYDRCTDALAGIDHEVDTVLVPAGVSTDEDEDVVAWELAERMVRTNFLAVMKLANRFLERFDAGRGGTLVLFSSIAAAAPRRRNVAYAAAKAALESYARSMQHRFAGTPVHVQLYALGYVDTALSRDQELRLPAVSTARVAAHVVRGLHRSRHFGYFPRYWGPIAFGLGRLPWSVYRRLAF